MPAFVAPMTAPPRSTSYFAMVVVALSVLGAIVLLLSRQPSRAPSGAGAAPSDPTPLPPAPASEPGPGPAGATSAPSPKHPTPKRVCTIAAIGDSLTDKKSHGGGYLDYVAKHCPQSRIINRGRGADMVNQMRRRFARDILSGPPLTHLIVFGGVNDLYSDLTAGRTPDKIAKDLLHMYTQAHERGTEVVAMTVAPWGGFRKYFNQRRSEATQELNGWIRSQFNAGTVDYVVDAYALLSCGKPEYLCPDYAKPFKDGIHFGSGGHEKLGQALYERVFQECS